MIYISIKDREVFNSTGVMYRCSPSTCPMVSTRSTINTSKCKCGSTILYTTTHALQSFYNLHQTVYLYIPPIKERKYLPSLTFSKPSLSPLPSVSHPSHLFEQECHVTYIYIYT
ncbi:hypothetical protein SORBI_3008G082550 [Sorghum bicolor]|uniref:Uncharacterized protein n=1 Tax=Sorghum bicolor TaxID=4558 RepID=A0A1Z5R5E3_SORBI|nr:hypothetical protein SORBI_3008G082550 [Sorghum bicolor]